MQLAKRLGTMVGIDQRFIIEVGLRCLELCQKNTKRRRRYGKKVRFKNCVDLLVDAARRLNTQSGFNEVLEKLIDVVRV